MSICSTKYNKKILSDGEFSGKSTCLEPSHIIERTSHSIAYHLVSILYMSICSTKYIEKILSDGEFSGKSTCLEPSYIIEKTSRSIAYHLVSILYIIHLLNQIQQKR